MNNTTVVWTKQSVRANNKHRKCCAKRWPKLSQHSKRKLRSIWKHNHYLVIIHYQQDSQQNASDNLLECNDQMQVFSVGSVHSTWMLQLKITTSWWISLGCAYCNELDNWTFFWNNIRDGGTFLSSQTCALSVMAKGVWLRIVPWGTICTLTLTSHQSESCLGLSIKFCMSQLLSELLTVILLRLCGLANLMQWFAWYILIAVFSKHLSKQQHVSSSSWGCRSFLPLLCWQSLLVGVVPLWFWFGKLSRSLLHTFTWLGLPKFKNLPKSCQWGWMAICCSTIDLWFAKNTLFYKGCSDKDGNNVM